jgi:zinc/manganese transport system substrate-binding protein
MRLLLAPAIALLLLSLACSDDNGSSSSDRLRVVATTTQIGDFVANVGGDRISLTVLLKPNQDAHDFEPEPSQLRALAQAALVLRNGLGLDGFVDKAVEGSRAKVVTMTDGIEPLAGLENEGEEEHGSEDHERDPHVWLSVNNARAMVENVRDALSEANPDNAGDYRRNADAYIQRLEALDAGIRAQVSQVPPACRKLVTNHDVLGYFAAAYGFEVVGSVIPSVTTDAQASAANVANIVRKIRAERVLAIFAESSSNTALINQVGREAGVKVVTDLYGDSLGPSGSDGGTYISMMETNTRKIVEALKDCSV